MSWIYPIIYVNTISNCAGESFSQLDSVKRILCRLCHRRAGIESVIGHVKSDCRMQRNYLSGWIGDQMNALPACTGYNLRKRLKQIKRDIFIPSHSV